MNKDKELRILVIKLSSFGDIVHTFPAFAYLRASLPGARIDWLVEKRFETLVALVNGIDNVVSADISAWRKRPFSLDSIKSIRKLKKTLRENRYDLVLDFQGLLKSAVYTRFTHSKIKAGFAPGYLRERAAAAFYNRKIKPQTSKTNVVYKNLSLAEQAVAFLKEWFMGRAVRIENSKLQTDYSHIFKQNIEARKRVRKLMNDIYEKRFILLHTGSSSRNKLLPEKTQAEFCDLIWQQKRLMPVLCGSGSDLVNAGKIASLCRIVKPLVLDAPLGELAEAMRMAYAFVGPDSGPLHLAAALGAKTIGYYGPTDPKRNGPVGKDAHVIEPSQPCRRPSCWKKCPDNICLKSIKAADILNFI